MQRETITLWSASNIEDEITGIRKWYYHSMIVSINWVVMALNYPTACRYFDNVEEAILFTNEQNRLEEIREGKM
mgnify:CR=1 FL=1